MIFMKERIKKTCVLGAHEKNCLIEKVSTHNICFV